MIVTSPSCICWFTQPLLIASQHPVFQNARESIAERQANWSAPMFSIFSIRTKIIAVISFLLVALAGLGLFATYQMQTIHVSTLEIQSNWLPKVRLLGHLRGHTIRYGSVVRDHVLETDPAKKASAEKILNTLTQEIEATEANYEPLIRSTEERALFGDFHQSWDAYVAQVADVLA